MTSTDCLNGTERCAETVEQLPVDYDIVVNLQGDAPLTPAWFIEDLINGLRADPAADIATPVLRCDGETLNALVQDRKAGRVGGTTAVFQAQGHALYFSKEVLPFTTETYSKEAENAGFPSRRGLCLSPADTTGLSGLADWAVRDPRRTGTIAISRARAAGSLR
jgi:3-deoxy-manno-octulosonate cytidylyltransferase (CMP-KDO synthetase)